MYMLLVEQENYLALLNTLLNSLICNIFIFIIYFKTLINKVTSNYTVVE